MKLSIAEICAMLIVLILAVALIAPPGRWGL